MNSKRIVGFAIANAVVTIAAVRCLYFWMRMFDLRVDDLGHLLYGHYLQRMLITSEFWLLVGLVCASVTFWFSGLRRRIVWRLFHVGALTLGVSVFALHWILPALSRFL
jgi:hypothetical protein